MRLVYRFAMLLSLGLASNAFAEDAAQYPSKPITFVVAFAAGGSTDSTARIIAEELGKEFGGATVLVDNRPGGSGVIGADAVVQAAPDGYTLMFGTSSFTNNPRLIEFGRQMEPVTMVAQGAYVLEVNADVPVDSLKSLIDLAKQKPGELNYATPGVGSTSHLVGELFKMRAGIDVAHVPYKGSAPALQDVVGKRVEMMFDAIPSSLGFIKAGQLKALAVTGRTRSSVLPDVPTAEEAGLADFAPGYWSGILAAPKTPKPIVDKINAAVVAVLAKPEIRKALEAQGTTAVGDTPDEFKAKMTTEVDTWQAVIKASNIVLE